MEIKPKTVTISFYEYITIVKPRKKGLLIELEEPLKIHRTFNEILVGKYIVGYAIARENPLHITVCVIDKDKDSNMEFMNAMDVYIQIRMVLEEEVRTLRHVKQLKIIE